MTKGASPEKLAYTVRDAATMLSLSRSLVYELINAGQIETIKIGRARRITANQLAAYIARHEANAPPGLSSRRP